MAKASKKEQVEKQVRKPFEIIKVPADADEVVCNGGNGALGHPQVWYGFEGRDAAACYYCGRKFVKTPPKA